MVANIIPLNRHNFANYIHDSVPELAASRRPNDPRGNAYQYTAESIKPSAENYIRAMQDDRRGLLKDYDLETSAINLSSRDAAYSLNTATSLIGSVSEGYLKQWGETMANCFAQLAGMHCEEVLNIAIPNKQMSMMGAVNNACASIFAYVLLLMKKLPHPDFKAAQSEWDDYTKRFTKMVEDGVHVVKQYALFHHDIQSIFHNLNEIYQKARYLFYEFLPRNFEIVKGVRQGANDSEELELLLPTIDHIEEIINWAKDPECMIVDDRGPHKPDYSYPPFGCMTLAIDTPAGNLFEEFYRFATKILKLSFIPNLKNFIEKLEK